MKKKNLQRFSIFLLVLATMASCATFKSDMVGKYDKPAEKNYNADGVEVLFIFSHYKQTRGYDAVPKLDRWPVNGFEEIFVDAMGEISNISYYSAFTDRASDVNQSKRRRMKDSLMNCHDYIVKVKFLREKSFAKHFFATIGSVVSATVLPMPYKYEYTLNVDVLDTDRKLVKTYQRKMDLTKWWQTFMLFLYPFKHEEIQKGTLYVEVLHDVFKQIETEKILEKK